MKNIAIVGIDWDIVDLIEATEGYHCVGFIDPNAQAEQEMPTLGSDADWPEIAAANPDYRVLLSVDNGHVRHKILALYEGRVTSITSSQAFVSPRSKVGEGAIIQKGVHISANANIGNYCKLNINATVHHDAVVGDFCTLAPGCQVLGSVTIGKHAYIGAGSIIKQHCRIGRGATVGAGAVVVNDVPDNVTVVGVPAIAMKSSKN